MQTLPLASVTAPGALAAVSPSLRHRKRILLVDDDTSILGVFTAVLGNAGYSVTSCPGSVEAIEQFRSQRRFDLLMTDFQMPVMDGVQLARLLTSVARRLSVLVVSGSAPEDIPLWDLWSRNWCFLPKPTSPALLLKTVDALCNLIPIGMPEATLATPAPFLLNSGHACSGGSYSPAQQKVATRNRFN